MFPRGVIDIVQVNIMGETPQEAPEVILLAKLWSNLTLLYSGGHLPRIAS